MSHVSRAQPRTAQSSGKPATAGNSYVNTAANLLAIALKKLSAWSPSSSSQAHSNDSSGCGQGVQLKEAFLKQEVACAGVESAVDQLENVKKNHASQQQLLHADSSSTTTKTTTTTSSSSSVQHADQGTLAPAAAGPRMPGVLKLLRQLVDLLASVQPQEGTATRSLPPPLVTRLTRAALRLYTCLVGSPDAGDSVETAAMMLHVGLLYRLQGGMLSVWATCTSQLLYTLIRAYAAAVCKPQPMASHIQQLLTTHKDLWWLGLSTAGSTLQQDRHRKGATGPGWASNRLAQALAPDVQLCDSYSTAKSKYLLYLTAAALLLVYSGLLCGRPLFCTTLQHSIADVAAIYGHDIERGRCPPITLLQLEALAEVLLSAALVQDMPGTVYVLLLLLALLVSAAEPEVKAAFLGSIYFQPVLRVLQQVAGWDMLVRVQCGGPTGQAVTAAAAPAAGTATASGPPLQPPPPAAEAQGNLFLHTCTSTGPQLVLLVLEVLTMEQHPSSGTGMWPALRHLYYPNASLGLLCWAPGLQHSPVLWGLLEQCVRAEGPSGQAGMRLAERWVQLAAAELVISTGWGTPSATGGMSSSQANASAPATSGITSSHDTSASCTTSLMTSSQGSKMTSRGRTLSWHAGLGSLLVSMAKVEAKRGSTLGRATWPRSVHRITVALKEGQAQQPHPCTTAEHTPVTSSRSPSSAAAQRGKGVNGAGSACLPGEQKTRGAAGPLQQQQQQQKVEDGAMLQQLTTLLVQMGRNNDRSRLLGAALRAQSALQQPPSTSTSQALTAQGSSTQLTGSTSQSTSVACSPPTPTTGAAQTEGGRNAYKPAAAPAAAAAATASVVPKAVAEASTTGQMQAALPGKPCSGAAGLRLVLLWCLGAVMWAMQQVLRVGAFFWHSPLGVVHTAHPGSDSDPTQPGCCTHHVPVQPRVSDAPARPPSSAHAVMYPAACAHISCTNLSGPSEVTLVTNRRGVVCGGCGVVRWCSQECAVKGWPAHGQDCKLLRALNLRVSCQRQAGQPPA